MLFTTQKRNRDIPQYILKFQELIKKFQAKIMAKKTTKKDCYQRKKSMVSLAITAKFSIVEIKMKTIGDGKLNASTRNFAESVPRLRYRLSLMMRHFEKHRAVRKKIEEIKSSPTLLPDMDKRALKNSTRKSQTFAQR